MGVSYSLILKIEVLGKKCSLHLNYIVCLLFFQSLFLLLLPHWYQFFKSLAFQMLVTMLLVMKQHPEGQKDVIVRMAVELWWKQQDAGLYRHVTKYRCAMLEVLYCHWVLGPIMSQFKKHVFSVHFSPSLYVTEYAVGHSFFRLTFKDVLQVRK
jgi:hypothetical protein